MAQRYAITNRAEALAYLAHHVLGSRLVHCTEVMLTHPDKSARQMWPPVRTRRGLAGVEMQTGFWLQAQKLRAIRA